LRSQAWFFGEGLDLPVEMDYDMTLANAAFSLAERWDASRSTSDPSKSGFRGGDIHGFNGNQIGDYFRCEF
jgi:leukotriene-A4 hydrolase